MDFYGVDQMSPTPLLIDNHGREVVDPVWALLDYTLERSGPKPVLIEWDNDVPDWPVLAAEAERAAFALSNLPDMDAPTAPSRVTA